MNKNKHLTPTERSNIELHLNNRLSFKAVGRELSKDPTTVAKEVKNHISFKSSGAYGRPFNDCIYRNNCTETKICAKFGCRNKVCKFCASNSCTMYCIVYQKEICHHLSKPPYVCNGGDIRRNCTLEKWTYVNTLDTKSMAHIVEKHGGVFQFSAKDGWFIFQATA